MRRMLKRRLGGWRDAGRRTGKGCGGGMVPFLMVLKDVVLLCVDFVVQGVGVLLLCCGGC